MYKDTRIEVQQSNEQAADLLWSWSFSVIDWAGMAIASMLFLAHAVLLISLPIIVERSGMMSSIPLFSVLITSAVLVVRPRSNTTRIPAVYIILLSATAIAINWSLL